MKTAVIGLGSIGSAVATLLSNGGVDVIVAERDEAKARALATKIGAHATASSIDGAVREADVLVLAIPFDGIKQFMLDYRGPLTGKIVVDPSNPIADDGKGGFKKTIPEHDSSGVVIAGLAPEGTEIVKAFGSLSATSLASSGNREPERAVLFYATDYPEAGKVVERLIRSGGFEPVSVGGIDQSVRMEVFGDLHEMGKAGKVLSLKEAKALL